ncbi:MAG: PAS domain S-box protein [Gracilimonas sp.]|nr:PAS domain S-box protein [Gracilimonas sp.]
MLRLPDLLKPNALSITVFYLVFAMLWILLSDQFLLWFTNDVQLISQYQTIKGLFYVAVTALFLYYLIYLSNEAISTEKQRIDTALYAAGMASWSIDLKTNKIQRSEFHHKLFGITKYPVKWNLNKFYNAIHPDDSARVREELEKTISKENSHFEVKYRVNTQDGEIQWMHSRGNLVYDGTGKATHLSGVVADITKQKRMEDEFHREKELFENVFRNIPVMIDITSDKGKTIRVNKAFQDITGFTANDLAQTSIMEFMYPDDHMRKKAWRSIEEADGTFEEFETLTKKGEKRIQRWANIRISDGSTIGIGMDITDQKELEHKHEQDRLELEKVYNNIPILINLYNEKNKVYRINKFFEQRAGYTNEDLKEIDLIETMIPDDQKEKVANHMQKADGSWQDFKIITKSGELIYTSWSNVRVTDDLSIGIGIDTTDLREKERELQALTNQYRNAEKLANFGHWKRDLNTNESSVSDGFYKIVEIDPQEEDFNFDLLKRVIHPDDFDFFLNAVERSYTTGTLDIHYRIIKQRSGDIAHIHELGRVEIDENGNPYLISGTVQDITETVEYQTQLQELAERYRKAEEIADFGHWWRDVINDQAIFSQGYYDIFGLKTRKRNSSLETSLKLIHPDDRDKYREAFENALESGSLNVRYRIIKPDTGEIGYFQELAETEYDEDGRAISISGTIQDTTEREEFQIALAQRNKFIEATFENLPIGVAVNLIDSGEVTIMNKKFAEIYGWPQDVLTDVDTFFKKVYPDEEHRKRMVEMVTADMASRNPDRMNWEHLRITTRLGTEKLINAKNIPLYDQNLMISTVVDVTAQVEAEERLSESEHNYRLLFQKSPQPMWIYDPETLKIIEVNDAAIKHYGFSRKEFYGMTLLDIRPKEDRKQFLNIVKGYVENNVTETTEWRHITKNKKIIDVRITSSSINYFGNEYRLVLVNDITEQKKAEQMVLASLVEGENKERARIAQELHDGLGQYLAAANMNLNSVHDEADALSQRKKEQLDNSLNLLQYAITETAHISKNLLPRVVDDYGLALAVQSLVESYKGTSDIKINYYHNISDLELGRELQFNLYRISQEGLSNALKYSEATEINIQLIKDELDLILSIDDNGIGFDVNSEDFEPGLGLQTIKTRAGALGGTFEFDSRPNRGTFLSVVVPIK